MSSDLEKYMTYVRRQVHFADMCLACICLKLSIARQFQFETCFGSDRALEVM